MREGVNPEKAKKEKNIRKLHRVIIPVYIPNIEEEYYKESLEVFERCLSSLFKTINPDTTVATIINDGSTALIDPVLVKYQGQIDKLVSYRENKGKVYAVSDEARSAFEPFITIADADVLFFTGWEQEVLDIFEKVPKAGIVSPLPTPNNAFYFNCSLFFDQYLKGNIGYDKIVDEKDLDLYEQGINFSKILLRPGSKYSWKEKQYYLKGDKIVLAGASHFIATYRSDLFKDQRSFPEYKFKKGYEESFLDHLADIKGLYRLSSLKCFAYHIGNRLDEFTLGYKPEKSTKQPTSGEESLKVRYTSKIPYFVKKGFFKILKHSKSL